MQPVITDSNTHIATPPTHTHISPSHTHPKVTHKMTNELCIVSIYQHSNAHGHDGTNVSETQSD